MFYVHSRSGMSQMMPSNKRRTKNESPRKCKRWIARRFTYAVLCCALTLYKHVPQPVIDSAMFYLHSCSPMCQMMPSNHRSIRNESCHPQMCPIARWFMYAVVSRVVITHCCVAQRLASGHSLCDRNGQKEAPVRTPDHRRRRWTHILLLNTPIGQRCGLAAVCNVVARCDRLTLRRTTCLGYLAFQRVYCASQQRFSV